jgi:hypothetical protein
MKSLDPVLFRELPLIQKIIADETWLEGERRGCYVRPDDRVVREKVCEIILRVGQQLREAAMRAELGQHSGGTRIPFPSGNEAA